MTMDGGDAPDRNRNNNYLSRPAEQDPYYYLFTLQSTTKAFVERHNVEVDPADRPLLVLEMFDSGKEVAILPPWRNLPMEIGDRTPWSWETLDMSNSSHVDLVINVWLLMNHPEQLKCTWEFEHYAEYEPYIPAVWRAEVDKSCILTGTDALMHHYSEPATQNGS